MADDKKERNTRKKAEKENKTPPHVEAVNVGSIGQATDAPVKALREANPEKEYRYVYAPEHKSDYSKLMARRIQGYSPVDMEDEDIDEIFAVAGSQLRRGDVVLCEIPKDRKKEREEELAERAKEDARRSQEVYEDHIRNTQKRGVGATPVGSVQRTSREYSVEMEE